MPDPNTELRYVMDAVRLIRRELDGRVPLIGFAGSPWTVGTYIVEGGSSREFSRIKAMMYEEPATLHSLLELLADSTRLYLNAQIAAGAQAVMMFDTWGGVLTPQQYREFSLHYMQRIVDGLTREQRRPPRAGHPVHEGRRRVARCDGADRLRRAGRRLDDGSRRCAPRRAGQRRAAGQSRPELPVCLAGDDSRRKWRACWRATVAATATSSISATAFIPRSTPEHAGAMIAAVHELSPPYHKQ